MSEFDPDVFLAQAVANEAVSAPMPEGSVPLEGAEQFNPDEFIEQAREAKYGTTGQMAKTFGEGVAEGVAGPFAPLIEKSLGINPEDIRERKAENPVTHGVGQATGLAGSMLVGTGEGALMLKAGELAADAAKVGKIAAALPEASYALKIGSAAVSNAAEMAVLQGSDEVSKMILNDPHSSAQTAMANIGLAAVLGGAGGAFMAGVASPLWDATAGPRVEALLNGTRNHFNGTASLLPEEVNIAKAILGIEIAPEIRAVMSGNELAKSHYGILREVENKGLMEKLSKFEADLSESVASKLKIDAADVAVYSENEAGHDLLNIFKKEYQDKYGPIAEALEKRNLEAAKIAIPDEARLDRYGKLLESGMNKVGTDSPAYKLYNEYGNRLLAKESVGGIDQLKTEIGGEIDKAIRAADTNSLLALRDIKNSLSEFQESQIVKQAKNLETSGVEGARKLSADLINERSETNRRYAEFSRMSGDLTDHLGTGGFHGAKSLTNKLTDKVSAEQLLNKFSFKGNSDFIPFLQKNFPEVYEKVRENELKRLLKPAILSAKGEAPLNLTKLNNIIEKGMAGQKEYIESIMPSEALASVQAANKLMSSLPEHKSSGTAGWMTKVFRDVPRSAMAAVGMLTGHNPLIGGLLGEMAGRLGRDAPDAIRLAHLKYMASDQPIKSEGFKAMVDFFHNTYKGETMLAKSTANVFKTGAEVLGTNQIPDESDRDKLDKLVTKMQDNPDDFIKSQNSQVGYYLPNHQEAITQASAKALQYLQSLKPQPHILGPLDKPVPPQPVEKARYNRALDIAVNPSVVLERVKDGTLQANDIQDLNSMYPAVYNSMVQKLSNHMMNQVSKEEPVPYKTRMGLSLFLGQPLDVSMQPLSILAAQPQPNPQMQQQGVPNQPKSVKSLGKSNQSYMTPLQSSESNKSTKD